METVYRYIGSASIVTVGTVERMTAQAHYIDKLQIRNWCIQFSLDTATGRSFEIKKNSQVLLSISNLSSITVNDSVLVYNNLSEAIAADKPNAKYIIIRKVENSITLLHNVYSFP